jgi:hypothetical protein
VKIPKPVFLKNIKDLIPESEQKTIARERFD